MLSLDASLPYTVVIEPIHFHKALWSSTQDAVLCLDEDGTIQCVNPQARDTFSWPTSGAFGSVDDLHIAHEDGRPFGWQAHFTEQPHHSPDTMVTCRSATDALLRFEAATTLVKVAEKSYLFCRLTKVAQQIEQVQAYLALKEKLYNFFYLSPSAVCVTDVSDGRIHEVNKSLVELSGYTEQELIGNSTLELGFWTKIEDRNRLVQQLRERGEGQVEAVLRNKVGRLIEGEINARMIYSEGAQQFITVFRDISQMKAAERAQLLINRATNDVVWDWDLQSGRIWYNNKVTMFGYQPDEFEDNIDWWKERVHPDDRQRVVERISYFVSHRLEKWFDKYRFRRRDGSFAYIYDRGHLVLNDMRTPVRMVGGMVDITERVLAEESILIKNRQIAEYSFFNSHKLRGPLARMMGLIKLIDFQEAHQEENKTLLNHLNAIAEELDELVKDVAKVLY